MKHFSHTCDKKTNSSYCVGALSSACLRSVILLKQDASLVLITLSLPSIINPSFHPAPPLSLCIFLSFLSASRFSASIQAGFKQLCGTSKCPSLCGLFRKADNDIPNPADLQLITLFHKPFTVILCPQTPPLLHLWLCRFNRQVPIFSQQGLGLSIISSCLSLRATDVLLLLCSSCLPFLWFLLCLTALHAAQLLASLKHASFLR